MLQLARNIKLTTKKAHHCKRNIRRGVLPISVISRHNKKILQRNRRHRSLDLKVPNTPHKQTHIPPFFSSYHFTHLLVLLACMNFSCVFHANLFYYFYDFFCCKICYDFGKNMTIYRQHGGKSGAFVSDFVMQER